MNELMNEFSEIKEFLPLLIPIVITQLVLVIYTVRHILTHNSYKRGNRLIWLVVSIVGMSCFGSIFYLILGKED